MTMKTMTYTIESVHGVKQILVLNPCVNTEPSDAPDQQSSGLDREAETESTPRVPGPPR